jgi:hypothetical protein
MMVIIVSVSSIFGIGWLYWCLSGLLVGYARVVHAAVRETPAEPAGARFA